MTDGLILALRDADRAATLALNGFSGGFTDALMPLLSNRLVWAPLYILMIWYIWKRIGWKRTLALLLAVVVCVGAVDQIANLVKDSVRRLRPCWDQYMLDGGLKVLVRKGGKYGFFSAHAATLSAVATSVLYFLKRWDAGNKHRTLAWVLVFWVAAVSVSRVYVGKHFVGDILAGAAAGVVLSFLISWFLRWVYDKFFTKFVN